MCYGNIVKTALSKIGEIVAKANGGSCDNISNTAVLKINKQQKL
jgi:hypothetical protein